MHIVVATVSIMAIVGSMATPCIMSVLLAENIEEHRPKENRSERKEE